MPETEMHVPELSIREATLLIEGTSPLITHKWSEKAKKQMLDKQQKKASKGKEAKDPQKDYEESIYYTEDGRPGFPAVGFKAAMVRGGTYLDMKMTFLRGAFHVIGEILPVDGDPQMREDMVRVQQTSDIRYRAEFPKWSVDVPLEYNERAISLEQLVQIARTAGFAVGVGEWRPERNGQFGRFTVTEVRQ